MSQAYKTSILPGRPLRLDAAELLRQRDHHVLHARVVAGTGGGPEKTILRSAGYADAAGLGMSAMYLHPQGDLGITAIEHAAREQGCDFNAVGERGPIDPNTIRRALRVCRECGITVWHAHDYKTDLLGLVLRRWHPMKLVTTLHGYTWETWRTQLYYRIDSSILRHYDHVIAVSPQLQTHARKCGVLKDRLSYIPNGIRMAEAISSRTQRGVREAWGMADDDYVVGVVARHSIEKGVDRAVRAFADFSKRCSRARLMLIGDGPQRASLASLARELGVADRVTFCGWQECTQDFYPAMDVLLLPSHTEGLPNVVLEAMVNRVPVVATQVGAVPDVLVHGACGRLLDDDEATWPAVLAACATDAQAQRAMALRGEARVGERFTFDRRMRDVFAVYDALLATRYADALVPREMPLSRAA